MKLHPWQLGFTEASFISGGTSAYNVFKCMGKDCHDGGATQKYPIEICPFLGGGLPGEGVEAFSIMTSIGGSVVTSAYLICLHAIRAGYFAAARHETSRGAARVCSHRLCHGKRALRIVSSPLGHAPPRCLCM